MQAGGRDRGTTRMGSVLPKDAEEDGPRVLVQVVEDQQPQRASTDLETAE